jgi:TetR/AcrR family transcriptional repressor of nem operon
MRYRPEHKVEKRRQIVQDAARRVRIAGLAGAAVSDVMRDAGLTHGGFYKHFASKDQLLVESLAEAFAEMSGFLLNVARHAPPQTAWKAMVKAYLSLEHCDHPERGCPLAALSSEFAHADKALKTRIVGELAKYQRRMLPLMPGRPAQKEHNFMVIISTMLGAVAIARILPDRLSREKVLAAARDFLLRSF